MALAENSGLQPIETLSAVKSQQIKVIIEHDDYFLLPLVLNRRKSLLFRFIERLMYLVLH
jgi:hypothetical protein